MWQMQYHKKLKNYSTLFKKDDTKTAENLRDQILSLLNDLGVDVNPIPIKLLTSELGFGQYEVRLPLVTLNEQEQQTLSKAFANFKDGVKQ